MSRRLVASVLAALSFVQSPAHAVLTDLPNPDDFDSGGEPQQQAPAAPVEKIPVQTQYTGTVNVEGVSRKSGGTSYKIELKQALSLSRIDVRIVKSQLRVLQMTLTTDTGQKVDVRQFKNTGVLATGSQASSEALVQGERISSIEILAEAFGGEADIILMAVADREVPKLVLKAQETTAAPQARPAPPPVQNVRIIPGDAVLSGPMNNNQYYTGRVVEIYAGGKVLVRDNDDGKTYVRDMSLLGKRVNCESSKNLCEGANVISGPFSSDKFYYGVVVEVYSNGKIRVRDTDDGKTYVRTADVIHFSIRCDAARNCVDDRVLSGPLSNKYYTGTIQGVFSNGLISVRDDDDGKTYFRKAELIMKPVRCESKSGLCVNDSVLSGPYQNKYYTGAIEGIYSNGLIYVRDADDGKLYPRKADDISKSVRCEGHKGICVNDRVLSGPFNGGKYYSGRVVGVYASGLVRVQDDDDGKVYVRNVDTLSKARNY